MVTRCFLLTLALLVLNTGCGQKSTIKNAVPSQRIADAYGDGKNVIRYPTFPLSDSALAYSTPLPGFAPIAGGILKFVGNIFAANTNMGRMAYSYTQPITPYLSEIPEELESVRLKRFMFYMKPSGKQRFRDILSRFFLGKGHVTFDFLDKLVVNVETVSVDDPDNYIPTLIEKDYTNKEFGRLLEIFEKWYRPAEVVDLEKAKSAVILRYHSKVKNKDTNLNDYGNIHYIEVNPEIPAGLPESKILELKERATAATKHFLMDQPKMKGIYERILLLENSLLIELKKDLVADETFKSIISESAEELERLGVNFIDTCTPKSCLELKVPDINLVPIARKGNSLKFDAVIFADRVPESFKLKGFVEFEVKVNTAGI